MEHLKSIGVFVRTVELQSFAAAAAALGLTPSAVSKSVGVLERSLGVRLLNRAARGVTPTDEGARFYTRCRGIMVELEAAEREATGSRGTPRGRLRVAVHTGLARGRVLEHLPRFLSLHPEIQLELLLAPGSRSLDAEGIDVGVFIGEPVETDLIAMRIGVLQLVTCASKSYLDVHGVPQVPQDLTAHNCMVYLRPNGRPYDEWSYSKGDETQVIQVRGNYCANEGPLLVDAAIAGCGIARAFHPLFKSFAGTGRLVPLLTEWEAAGPPVHVMYRRGSKTSPKVRVFVDFVTDLFEDSRDTVGPGLPPRRSERWPMYRA